MQRTGCGHGRRAGARCVLSASGHDTTIRPDPADRRAYRIYLTPLAGSHLQAVQQVAAKIRKQVLHGVGEQQALVVMSALRKMRDNLSAS